ncbi:MAG: response regulator [Mariprofundaceae bacterium]|nr:response regulator [Mariprofundaceae bacterium]
MTPHRMSCETNPAAAEDAAIPVREQSLLMQTELFRRCLTASMAFVIGFSVINLNSGYDALGWTELVMAGTFGLTLWWSYHGAPVFWLRNIIIGHAAILFFIMFFHGGSSGLGYVWALGFPLVACFMTGSRTGLGWSAVYALTIGSLWAIGWPETGYPEFAWQKMAYLGLVYLAFTLVAHFATTLWEESGRLLLEAEGQLKQEAAALAESEANHRVLLEHSPNPVGVHRDGKWIYMNPAAVVLFAAESIEDVLGTPVLDYIHPEHHPMAIERMQIQMKENVAVPVVEEKLLRKNGEMFIAEVQGSPVIFDGEPSFLTTCRDLSESRKYEEKNLLLQSQLEHSRRLESLGVLAGGIAHDFNNLLAAIMANAELARMEVKEPSPASEHFDNIEETCDQAAELCKQMLVYAGRSPHVMELLEINGLVQDMASLLRASLDKNIDLQLRLDEQLLSIEADKAQIQQVILNFIINAAEAIGSDAGNVRIRTGIMHADREFLDRQFNGTNLPEGKYVFVTIADSGCGMTDQTMRKIFDPFFTRKESGTGLGLSAVLGIIHGHKGVIEVVSKAGKGSKFRILLPRAYQAPGKKVILTSEMDGWQGDGTVLVVDDDPAVRRVASLFLSHFHFEVLQAADGLEGLETFCKHQKKIVAVLLDITMPKLGGVDAMKRMREANPRIPVILVSGYSKVEIESLAEEDQPDMFVAKPFRAKDLKKALYKVLEKP